MGRWRHVSRRRAFLYEGQIVGHTHFHPSIRHQFVGVAERVDRRAL